jgi:hypothetical protein
MKYHKHKFNAKPAHVDQIRFDSTLEAAYYTHLKTLQSAQEVIFFLRQTPFHLPGGVRYVVDFTVFYSDGTVKFIDVKGMITDTFKMKLKMVEDLYPIKITIVKRGEF